MGEFLHLASRPPVVRRALGFAVVVGVILITINYGDRILRGESLGMSDFIKIGLTLCVPYVVSTLSSVAAMSDHGMTGGPTSDDP